MPRFLFLLFLLASNWGAARRVALVKDPALNESSGVAASRRHPGLYWTHNDSGDTARLFLFDLEGRIRAVVSMAGAKAVDWEDVSVGPGRQRGETALYAADIGDNRRRRALVQVYRVPEPARGAKTTAAAEEFRFRYPDGPHDAEALLVEPVSGDVYVVTKAQGFDWDTVVFRAKAPLRDGATVTLERVARLRFPGESALSLLKGRVTGGDIAPDGRHAMLCDYEQGWEYRLPRGAKDFDEIWKTEPVRVDLGPRPQGEGVCYRLDGDAVVATSEGTPMPVFETKRHR